MTTDGPRAVAAAGDLADPVEVDRLMQATCAQCGLSFEARRKDQRFCSPRCNSAAHRDSDRPCSEPDCSRPVRARELCSGHWKQRYGTTRYREATCPWCQKICRKRIDQRFDFCSESCAQRYRHKDRKQLVLWVPPADWAERQRAKLMPAPPPPRWFQAGQCRVCKTWFVSPHTHLTCSDECQARYERAARREAKHRRRARRRNSYVSAVNSLAIYQGDGFRCHLCGKKLDMAAEVPSALAPTIDHLIPLSKGGTHESANVKAAHFLCNAIKGDRVAAVQAMLFG